MPSRGRGNPSHRNGSRAGTSAVERRAAAAVGYNVVVDLPHSLGEDFLATAHRIVWSAVATVDRRGRPRSRILHPYWEHEAGRLRGWVITRPSPVKVAHLEVTPFVSCSYWDTAHDVAIADCAATWVDDEAEVQRVWDLFLHAPPPLGYDFTNAYPDGPSDPECRLLRFDPWRVLLDDVARMRAREPARLWVTAL